MPNHLQGHAPQNELTIRTTILASPLAFAIPSVTFLNGIIVSSRFGVYFIVLCLKKISKK
jgi:hypothetical protein